MAVTPAGDILVADTWNCRVRKIDAKTGVISTIVGTGEKGFSGDGGPATRAACGGIYSLALDVPRNRLIFADLDNRRIRVLHLKTGVVETVAGNGESGVPMDGADARSSPLVDPRAVAAQYAAMPEVQYAEPNGIVSIAARTPSRTESSFFRCSVSFFCGSTRSTSRNWKSLFRRSAICLASNNRRDIRRATRRVHVIPVEPYMGFLRVEFSSSLMFAAFGFTSQNLPAMSLMPSSVAATTAMTNTLAMLLIGKAMPPVSSVGICRIISLPFDLRDACEA